MKEETKVFIVGPARSGTSIMFYAMKEVFGLPGRGEGHVFPAIQRVVHSFYLYSREFAGVDGVLAKELDTREFKRHLSGYVQDFYKQAHKGGSWVDKTPGSEAILGIVLIKEVFPQSRIIVNRRSGIEVVRSHQSKFSASLEDACRSWVNCMQAIVKIRASGLSFIEVDQFDLTNRTEETANDISVFLGSPDKSPQLCSYFLGKRTDQHSSHDWRNRQTLADVDWSASEKALFREVCGPAMDAFGYPM